MNNQLFIYTIVYFIIIWKLLGLIYRQIYLECGQCIKKLYKTRIIIQSFSHLKFVCFLTDSRSSSTTRSTIASNTKSLGSCLFFRAVRCSRESQRKWVQVRFLNSIKAEDIVNILYISENQIHLNIIKNYVIITTSFLIKWIIFIRCAFLLTYRKPIILKLNIFLKNKYFLRLYTRVC